MAGTKSEVVMSSWRLLSLFMCALICASCSPESGVDPAPVIPPQESGLSERATSLELAPDSIVLDEGGEQQLAITVRNQAGRPMGIPQTITFSTTSDLTAMVGEGGFVTAIAPGRAVVRAKLVIGASTFVDSAVVIVRKVAVTSELVLKAVLEGWTPSPAHVAAGGTIEWQPGVVWGGGMTTMVYVWRDDLGYGKGQSIDFNTGARSMVLTVPGKYRYCSNACWDPPEFGIIVVH